MSVWLFVWVENVTTGRPEPQKWAPDMPTKAQHHLKVLASHELPPGDETKSLGSLAETFPPPEQEERPIEWSTGTKSCGCEV